MARVLVLPAVLVVVPFTLGCGDTLRPDGDPDAHATVDALGDGATDAGMDTPDTVEETGVDIVFSERRVDVVPPDGAMCLTERNDAGMVVCREEGFPVGSGFLCLRYLCDVDDGGTSTEGCCRLVS